MKKMSAHVESRGRVKVDRERTRGGLKEVRWVPK